MRLRLGSSNPGSTRLAKRRGFTLLELLLASVCAAMLLSALYFSFDMTIEQTQVSVDSAGTEDLTRGVINRMAIDMNAILGPQPAQSGGTAGMQLPYALAAATSGSTSTGGTGAGGGTGSGGGGGGMAGASTTGASTTGGTSSTTTPLLGSGLVIPLQAGVIGGYEGNNNMIVLFTSRIPDIFTSSGPNSLAQLYNSQGTTSSNNNIQVPADLRRVVYWLGSNGGLYRYETPWVTGVNTWNLSDLPLPDSQGVQIAEEVKDLLFEYYDPYELTWETTWDGTGGTSPPYSMQPGPPAAIRVTLTFEFGNPRGGSPIRTTIAQVFPILTAPGQTTMTLYNPTAGGSSTGSGGNGTVGANAVGASTVGGSATGAAVVGGK